jgi:chromosome partitioning protein
MAYVIAVATNKGGAGKTTSAINIADGLARENKSVLLIDADEQASASAWRRVRLDAAEHGKADREPLFQMVAMKTPILHKELPALLSKSSFDYVVVDCPPGAQSSAAQMTRSALLTSDLVIVPVTPSGFDFWASDPMVQLLKEVRIYIEHLESRLLINRKMGNTRIGREARTGAELFEMPIFQTEISQRIAVAESTSRGLTIYEFEYGGISASEYNRLIQEIVTCQASTQLKSSKSGTLIQTAS